MSPSHSSIQGSRRRSSTTRLTPLYARPLSLAQMLGTEGGRAQVVPDTYYSTGYRIPSPPDFTNYDMRVMQSVGYFDWDVFYHTRADHQHQGAVCGTNHGYTNQVINLGPNTPPSGLSVVSGLARGDQPETLTWGVLKHGRTVQTDWDNGGTSGATQTQDGNGFRLGMKNGSYYQLDGCAIYNVMDGINLRGDPGTTASHGVCWVNNTYIGLARDTAFTSEQGHVFRCFDCLVERTYGLIDMRNGPNVSSLFNQWDGCVIRLQKNPGGFHYPSTASTHNKIYKDDTLSPKLRLRKCYVGLEDRDEPPNFPGDGTYENVVICWEGTGSYPWTGDIHPGMTVINQNGTARQEAIDTMNAQVADWKSRHGFVSYDNFDRNAMLNALPPAA